MQTIAQGGAHRIRELAVWVGGTLLPDLDAAAGGVLRAAGAPVGAAQMVEVHRLAERLTWGALHPSAFWGDLGALLDPPLPWTARPGYGLIASGGVALLPRWVRSELRLPVSSPVAGAAGVLGLVGTRAVRWATAGVAEERRVTPRR